MSEELTPRARRRRQTTAEILDAAWGLARRHGLASIAMRDLGRAVGLRAQSLYAYFDSKAALYDAMFRQGRVAPRAVGDVAGELRHRRRAGRRRPHRDPDRASPDLGPEQVVQELPIKIPVKMGDLDEKWDLDYFLGAILTRDAWLHRVDLADACRPVPVARN